MTNHTENNTNNNAKNPKNDNISYIHHLNRKLLHAINKILSRELPEDEKERKRILADQERILGGKNSVAAALGDVADTELKIEKQRPTMMVQENAEASFLDEKDEALVDEFIEKNKQRYSPP